MELLPDNRLNSWMYNVEDRFKGMPKEEIKNILVKEQNPFAVLMEHWQGDFNIGSCLRSCNAMGGMEMFYLGKRKWDRRAAVGVHNYTDIIHLKNRQDFIELKKKYRFVALENTVSEAQPIYDYTWSPNSLIIVGEEGVGITEETLKICDDFVYIPQFGSIRSLNAAAAVSIAAYDFVSKHKKNTI